MAPPETHEAEVSYSVGSGFAVAADGTELRQTNSLPFQCTCSPRFSFFDCDEDVVAGSAEMLQASRTNNNNNINRNTTDHHHHHHSSNTYTKAITAMSKDKSEAEMDLAQVSCESEGMRRSDARRSATLQPLSKPCELPLQASLSCDQSSRSTQMKYTVSQADDQSSYQPQESNQASVGQGGNDGASDEVQVVCCSGELPAHLQRFMTNSNNKDNTTTNNLLASNGAQSAVSYTTPCPLSPAAASVGATPKVHYVELSTEFGKAYSTNATTQCMNAEGGQPSSNNTVTSAAAASACSGAFAPSASYSKATIATACTGNNGATTSATSYDTASASYVWGSGAEGMNHGNNEASSYYGSPMTLINATPSSSSSWMCAASSAANNNNNSNSNNNNSANVMRGSNEEYILACDHGTNGLTPLSQDGNGASYFGDASNYMSTPSFTGGRAATSKGVRRSQAVALNPADLFAVPSPAANAYYAASATMTAKSSINKSAVRTSYGRYADPACTHDPERPLPYQGQAPMPLSPSMLTQSQANSSSTRTSAMAASLREENTTESEKGNACGGEEEQGDDDDDDDDEDMVRAEDKEQTDIPAAAMMRTMRMRYETAAGSLCDKNNNNNKDSMNGTGAAASATRGRTMSASEGRSKDMTNAARTTLQRGGATIHIEPTAPSSASFPSPLLCGSPGLGQGSRALDSAAGGAGLPLGVRAWLAGRGGEDQTDTPAYATAKEDGHTMQGDTSGSNAGSLTPGMSYYGHTSTPNTAMGAAAMTPSAHARSNLTSPMPSSSEDAGTAFTAFTAAAAAVPATTPLRQDAQSDLALPPPLNSNTRGSALPTSHPSQQQQPTTTTTTPPMAMPSYTAFSRGSTAEAATVNAMMSSGLWLPYTAPCVVSPSAAAAGAGVRTKLTLSEPAMSYGTTTSALSAAFPSFTTAPTINLPGPEAAMTQSYFMYSPSCAGVGAGGLLSSAPLYMTSAGQMTANYAAAGGAAPFLVSAAAGAGLVDAGQACIGFPFASPSYFVSAPEPRTGTTPSVGSGQQATLTINTTNNNSSAATGKPQCSVSTTPTTTTTTTATNTLSAAMLPSSSSFASSAAMSPASPLSTANSCGNTYSVVAGSQALYPPPPPPPPPPLPLSQFIVSDEGLFYPRSNSNSNSNNNTTTAANNVNALLPSLPREAVSSTPNKALDDSTQSLNNTSNNGTPRLLVIGSASNPSIHRRWSNVHGALIGSARYVPYNDSAEPALTTIITAVNLQDFASRVLIDPCAMYSGGNAPAANEQQQQQQQQTLVALQSTLASMNGWSRAAFLHELLNKQGDLGGNGNLLTLPNQRQQPQHTNTSTNNVHDPNAQAILDALGATVIHRELSAHEQAMAMEQARAAYLMSAIHKNSSNESAYASYTSTAAHGGNEAGEEEAEEQRFGEFLSAVSGSAPRTTMPCVVVGTTVIPSAHASQAASSAAGMNTAHGFHHSCYAYSHHSSSNSNSAGSLANAEIVPIFVQMFPCELRDRVAILNHVIAKTCGPEAGLVVGLEFRSETSFIALVRTHSVWWLIYQLRCRVLMDRHGFWYAENMEQYLRMKLYCEAVRRLPQQTRHFQTDGLPCMPLVVELSRSVDPTRVCGSPAPQCFDEVVPISSLDRRGARVYHSHPQQPRMMHM